MTPSRTYDHRIREAIVRSGDPNLFPRLNIPRSTTRAWIRRGQREVVTLEPPDDLAVRVYLSRVEAHEIWHIDASVLRLVDGTRVCLHAVIDNFSRRILAWCVEERLNPMNTFRVLSEAAKDLPSARPAQVYSVRRLVAFYVQQHNEVMPHSAFNGATPDEVCFEKSNEVVEHLKAQRAEARTLRLAMNRKASCSECSSSPSIANAKPRVLPDSPSSKQLGAVATG